MSKAKDEACTRTDQQGRGSDAFGVISEGYKLVRNLDRQEGMPEFELYDHAKDPLDLNDIASQNQAIVERLSQQLEGWQKWAQHPASRPCSRLPDRREHGRERTRLR